MSSKSNSCAPLRPNCLILAVICIVSGAAMAGEPVTTKVGKTWYSEMRELYWGIPVSVSFRGNDNGLSKSVWSYLQSVDEIFNDYRKDTEISKLNSSVKAGKHLVSASLADAFAKAAEANRLSSGVFDVTCGPMRRLWRKAEKQNAMPSASAIAAMKKVCGQRLLRLNGKEVSISTVGVRCDFGGIVKGIAADEAISRLRKGGATSALVQVGGDTVAYGMSPKGRPYRIAIQHPTKQELVWCVIQDPGTGMSCSTSGNYENPIVINGRHLYHIFDPRTGRPVETNVVSVSIVFPATGKNWLADSLSTAGTILGPQKTFAILKKLGGEAMFLILEKGKLREVTTPGWRKLLP